MIDANCGGDHRFFVAETGFDKYGKIVVILVCTACGAPLKHEFSVAGTEDLQLQSQTKKEK